jgi:hypothetical protein
MCTFKSLCDVAGFFHRLQHTFIGENSFVFLPRFRFSPFSSSIIRSGPYDYLGAATDSWSRTCSLPTYDFSVPAANLKRLLPSPPPFSLILCFSSFNFACVYLMSSHNVEFAERSGGALLRTPCRVTHNGWAVRVRPHSQFLDTAPALVSEGKSKKDQAAPDPEKKWKVILW